ncbi:TPA: hypothetical protein ACGAON_002204 [Citrobacter freundii]|uniref:hypothetical protein n=1 Tax=Citrobacter freundii TaxID=546 RepID=UPI000D59909F|nr:hypothetical protein [Citrobacter freundii]EKU2332983.1 hypothetical protein [Citrobacter freundii]EKW9290078.1 hypothetical protein [Citrobacter freundii]MBD5685186.1 hypothetical protein [Citrobacter freundii]MBE9969243.1 hypothetical protein [Citrobacter freundii]MBE9979044.1 hypothetical protein [Citrobacter freundii]
MSKIKCDPLLWPEGEQFTREVLIPTKFEPLPVEITYIVPPFEVVVETWQNRDPAKGYTLFRQFIVDWDQQDKLTDDVLIAYLIKWPGTDMAIFDAWAEHMKDVIAKNLSAFPAPSCTLN